MENWLYVGKVIQDRLWRRFSLREYPQVPDPLLFNKTIIGVTNIDELLKKPKIEVSGDIPIAATGWVDFHTVPPGKRHTVIQAYLVVSSGTFTFNQIAVFDGSRAIAIYKPAGSETSVVPSIPVKMPMPEGWTLRCYINSFSGAGNLNGYVLVEEEDAYS